MRISKQRCCLGALNNVLDIARKSSVCSNWHSLMTGGYGNIVVWTEFMRPPLSWDSGGLTRGSPGVPYLPLNRSLELPGRHCLVRRSRAAGAAHNWLFLPEALFKILVPTFPRTLTLNAPAKCWTLFCVFNLEMFGFVWSSHRSGQTIRGSIIIK